MDLQNMEQKTYFMYFCITICLHRSGFYLCKVQVKQNKKSTMRGLSVLYTKICSSNITLFF